MDIEDIVFGLILILGVGYNIYKTYGARIEKGYCIRSRSVKGIYYATFEYDVEFGGQKGKYVSKVEGMDLFTPKEGREYRLLVKKAHPNRIYVYRTFIRQMCFFVFFLFLFFIHWFIQTF